MFCSEDTGAKHGRKVYSRRARTR